ncbi:MAG: DUF4836 family protein [Bacteroidota bacterium]
MPVSAKIRSFSSSAAILLCSVFLLASCGKPEQIKYVPKNALAVASVNGKSIALKAADFKSIWKGIFNKKEDSDTTGIAHKLDDSGIDFFNTAYVYSAKAGEKTDVVAVIPLADAGKFEALVVKEEKGAKITSEAGFKQLIGNTAVYIWNDHTALAAFSKGEDSKKDILARLMKTVAESDNNSLVSSNAEFKKITSESSDFSYWVNLKDLSGQYGASAAGSKAAMAGVEKSYLWGSLNFESGEVKADATTETVMSQNAKSDIMFGLPVSKDVVGHIPSEKPAAVLALKFDADKVYQYLAAADLLSGLDANLAMAGSSAKEIFEMLSGDLTIAITAANGGMPQGYFELGLRKEATFNKLVDIFAMQGLIAEEEGYRYVKMYPEYHFITQKDRVYVVNTPELEKLAADAGHPKPESAIADPMASGVFGLYFDINALTAKDSRLSLADRKFISNLDKVTFTVKQESKTTAKSEFSLKLQNKTQNSLQTLLKAASDYSEDSKKAVDEFKEAADSVVVQ